MPDPIDELSNFEPGVPVNPMPAAEVRRRGDRLRRRNTALVVGGAVAAVVLVAVPIAVVAGGDDGGDAGSRPAPALTSDVLLTADELPARDRLTPWRGGRAGGQILACAPQRPASLDAVDVGPPRLRGRRRGGPGRRDPACPSSAPRCWSSTTPRRRGRPTTRRRAGSSAAPAGTTSPQGRQRDHVELDDGQGEWRRHDFYAPDICTECDAIRFDRMGIAQFDDRMVLVSLAEVGGPLEPEGLDASMNELFQAAVTKAGGEITGAGEREAGEPATPLDFPLGHRPADRRRLRRSTGPGPTSRGSRCPSGYCGARAWPPATPVAGSRSRSTGPEYGLWRELVTFDSARRGRGGRRGPAAAVEDCPTVARPRMPANDLTFVSHDVDSGYDDATFSYTYARGSAASVYQFVRVGHAVLATAQSGEWSPRAPRGPAPSELNGENPQLTALMCEYTARLLSTRPATE